MNKKTTGDPFAVTTRSAGEIHGLRWGDRDAPAVLALHGWLDNAQSFAPMALFLEDVQILALDLPGHGHSQHRPVGARYHLLDYLPAVTEAADALGLAEMVLMGHSLGGAIAGLLAATVPERIHALILLEAIGPLSEPEEKAPGRLRDSLLAHANAYGKTPQAIADLDALVQLRARVGDMSEASAGLLISRNVMPLEGRYQWRSDPRLKLPSPLYFSEAQVLKYLKAITVPTAILLASNGLPAEREHLKPRLACIPSAKVQWFEGAHHVHMDAPQPVASAVSEFLSEHGLLD
ncbi:MAG: alpha/beta fold hydrolase [Arenicellales bacterium]